MKLRLTRAWRNHVRGSVIEPPGGAAKVLLQRGLAEPVLPETETASLEVDGEIPLAEQAAKAKRRRKR